MEKTASKEDVKPLEEKQLRGKTQDELNAMKREAKIELNERSSEEENAAAHSEAAEAEIKKRNEALAKELKEAEADINRLTAEANALKNEMDNELKPALEKTTKKADYLTAEVKKLKEDLAKAEADKDQADRKLAVAQRNAKVAGENLKKIEAVMAIKKAPVVAAASDPGKGQEPASKAGVPATGDTSDPMTVGIAGMMAAMGLGLATARKQKDN